jgi:hypothetical protein
VHAAARGPRWAPRATLAMPRPRHDLTAAEPRIRELMAGGGTAASISATLTAEGVVGASRATVGRRLREIRGRLRHRRRRNLAPPAGGQCASFPRRGCQSEAGVCERSPRIEAPKEPACPADLVAVTAKRGARRRSAIVKSSPSNSAAPMPTPAERIPVVPPATKDQRRGTGGHAHGAGASCDATRTLPKSARLVNDVGPSPVAPLRRPAPASTAAPCLKCGAPRGAHGPEPELRCPELGGIRGIFRSRARAL